MNLRISQCQCQLYASLSLSAASPLLQTKSSHIMMIYILHYRIVIIPAQPVPYVSRYMYVFRRNAILLRFCLPSRVFETFSVSFACCKYVRVYIVYGKYVYSSMPYISMANLCTLPVSRRLKRSENLERQSN